MLPLLGGKLVGMVRDDEKHSFMMYGNLPSEAELREWLLEWVQQSGFDNETLSRCLAIVPTLSFVLPSTEQAPTLLLLRTPLDDASIASGTMIHAYLSASWLHRPETFLHRCHNYH